MTVHIVQENTNKTEKAERSLRMENLTSFKTNCLGVSLENIGKIRRHTISMQS